MVASYSGHYECVKELIMQGADINYQREVDLLQDTSLTIVVDSRGIFLNHYYYQETIAAVFEIPHSPIRHTIKENNKYISRVTQGFLFL